MRVLVTGRGSIARRHVSHLRELVDNLELAVVAGMRTVDPEFGSCAVFPTMQAALAWQPEAVVIAGISSKHASELETCLRLGLPCLAEKPLAVNQSQLRALELQIAACAALPAVLVGCNLRYLPALKSLRAAMGEAEMGRVLRAQFEVGQDLAQWRPGRDVLRSYSADASMGGGVMFDLVHEIDMALWLVGPLTVKSAIGGQFGVLPILADDVHVALLMTARGAPVVITLDYLSKVVVRRYSIVVDSGTFEIDLIKKSIVFNNLEGSRIISNSAEDFDIQKTYALQMADWLYAISDISHPVQSSLSEALATAKLMLAMKDAAA